MRWLIDVLIIDLMVFKVSNCRVGISAAGGSCSGNSDILQETKLELIGRKMFVEVGGLEPQG